MGTECCQAYKEFAEEELKFRLNSPHNMQGIGSPNQPIITHLQTLALQTSVEEDEYILETSDLQKLVRL